MSVISKFEGMMEGVVEGSFSRLFRSRLQPAEIQKKLERAMEDKREIALGKSFVPNRYDVYLNPEDYSQFAPHKANLEREMSNHLRDYAQQRRFNFSGGPPRVWLNSDEQVKKRGCFLKAYTVDPNQVVSQPSGLRAPSNSADENLPSEGTAILNVGAIALTGQQKAASGSPAFSRPEASLVVLEYNNDNPGKYVRFNRDVSIGRGLDNDVVLADNEGRVSRHHARIEFKYGQFILTDLSSTNGTKVNGQPVKQVVLAPADRISFGGMELTFQL